MPTFKQTLVWPIGPGGTLRSSQGQRVNVYDPGTTTVPAGLTQGGQAVPYVTSDRAGRCEFTTTSANVVDLASPDGSFTRRVESQENIGAGGGGTVADATTTTKGVVQLAGDLAGTAAAPTVPGLAGKSNTGHTHAAADVNSGTLAVARLGTGTPAAGKYVDGGTGAWTALPAGGGSAALMTKPNVNDWFTSPYLVGGGATGQQSSAARIFIPAPAGITVGAAGLRIYTAGPAGATCTITAYSDDGNGRATTTVLGSVALSTAAGGFITGAFTPFVTTGAGFWYGVTWSEGTAQAGVANAVVGIGSGVGTTSLFSTNSNVPMNYTGTSGGPVQIVGFQRTA